MAGKVEPRTSNEAMSPVGRSVPVISAQFFLTPYVQRGILIFFFDTYAFHRSIFCGQWDLQWRFNSYIYNITLVYFSSSQISFGSYKLQGLSSYMWSG